MPFTYSDKDEARILEGITDPVIKQLVQLVFDYASQAGGLSEADFIKIEQLVKE